MKYQSLVLPVSILWLAGVSVAVGAPAASTQRPPASIPAATAPSTSSATNPTLLSLGTDELFGKCLATTGTDYAQAKAVLVARPKEAEVLAKKVLDNKDAPWLNRILAQALTEEVGDPGAYSRARHELLRLGYLLFEKGRHGVPHVMTPEYITRRDAVGLHVSDPVLAPENSDAGRMYRVLTRYPGLTWEVLAKSTADSLLPQVAAIAAEISQAAMEERIRQNVDPPLTFNAEEFIKRLRPGEAKAIERCVKTVAAYATTYANTKDTSNFLSLLDDDRFHDVVTECRASLEKRSSSSQPAQTQK
jgi:hypothetical protein